MAIDNDKVSITLTVANSLLDITAAVYDLLEFTLVSKGKKQMESVLAYEGENISGVNAVRDQINLSALITDFGIMEALFTALSIMPAIDKARIMLNADGSIGMQAATLSETIVTKTTGKTGASVLQYQMSIAKAAVDTAKAGTTVYSTVNQAVKLNKNPILTPTAVAEDTL